MTEPQPEDLEAEVRILDEQVKDLLDKRDKLREAVDDIIERSDALKVVAKQYKQVLGVENASSE